ncbi:hypothetical protein F4860DRAFT_529588 [Xylaria cubensis]|nr:hypothetical protein F4860DRAFT_529588 [Xylaria cubensis]
MACSRVSAINKPIRLSLHERLFNNQGKYLYKKPLNWTDDHLQLFKCKFSESNKVDNGEPALSEESVDDVQRLATTGDPFAIQNLLNSYINEPASEKKLEFLFDYDIFGAREHLLRILLPGAFVLADVPGSICYLNLSEVERKRKKSGGCSNVTQKDHDPFVAATAIAMAQRLGVKRYRMIPSPRVQQMVAQLGLEKEEELDKQQHKQKELNRQQRMQQIIAQQDRKNKEREERQQKKQERKLQKHVAKQRAQLQHELKQRKEQKLKEQKLKQQKLKQQKLKQQKLEQQKLEQQKLEEQKLKEQKLEEQKLKEVQHELEQREEQKLEEQKLEQQKLEQQKLEQQKLEQQKLEELRREFEQPQSLAIDDAPAFKHHWRVKAALGRIMRMAVK